MTPEVVMPLSPGGGTSAFSIAVPQIPVLNGQHAYVQMFGVDVVAGGSQLVFTSTNATDGRVGAF